MSRKLLKFWVLFFLIAWVILLNARLFNYSTKGTILYPWKQYIWAITLPLFLFFPFGNSRFDYVIRQKRKFVINIISILLIYASFTYFIQQFSIIRIIFGIWRYTSGIGFVLLPILWNKLGWQQKNLILFLVLIIFFSSLGLTIDGNVNVFSFLGQDNELAKEYGELEVDSEVEIYRASFLFDTPTAIGYTLVFGLICAISLCFFPGIGLWVKGIAIVTVGTTITGSFYTGSRQIFFLMPVAYAWSLLEIARRMNFLVKASICFFIIAGCYLGNIGYKQLLSHTTQIAAERFTSFNINKDERVRNNWYQGLQQFEIENFTYWFTGHGISYVTLQWASPGEISGSHYESSVFSTFSETGYFGLFFMYWVVGASYLNLRKGDKILISRVLIAYLPFFVILSFVAPTLTHHTAQMIIWSIYGISLVNLYGTSNKINPYHSPIRVEDGYVPRYVRGGGKIDE